LTITTNQKTGRKILSLNKRITPIPKRPATSAPAPLATTTPPKPPPKPVEVVDTAPKAETTAQISARRLQKIKLASKWLSSFEVIDKCLPLKVGINRDIAKLRPENIPHKAVRYCLRGHIGSKRYRDKVDGQESTVQRYELDGSKAAADEQ
jgi:hypothetical protein